MDKNVVFFEGITYKLLGETLAYIGDGVISTDIGGRVIFMNSTAEEITGWKADEAHGRNIQEIMTIVDLEKNNHIESPVILAICAGSALELKNYLQLITKDGIEKSIFASCSSTKDDKGNVIGIVITFRDTTEIKHIEEELIMERNNFKTMVDANPMSVVVVDENVTIKQVNPAFLDNFKKSNVDVINQRMGNILNCVNSYNNIDRCGFSEECNKCRIREAVLKVMNTRLRYNEPEIYYTIMVECKEIKTCLNLNFLPVKVSGRDSVMMVIGEVTQEEVSLNFN